MDGLKKFDESFTEAAYAIHHGLKEKAALLQTLNKEVSGFWDTYLSSGNAKIDSMRKLASTGLDKALDLAQKDPAEWADSISKEEIENIIGKVKAVKASFSEEQTEELTEEEEWKFNVFDSLRTVISSIPIVYRLNNATVSIDPSSTAHIPITYSATEGPEPHTGVIDMSRYMVSLVPAVLAPVLDNYIKAAYLELIPGVDDPYNEQTALNYIKATEESVTNFKVKDASGAISFRAWVETSKPRRGKAAPRRAEGQSELFTLSCDNPTAVIEDGVLTFTGDSMLSVTPNTQQDGTLYIEDSEGRLYTYNMEVVPSHTCAGDWETLLPPTEEDGCRVRRCSVCGELLDIDFISACRNHRFSRWQEEAAATCVSNALRSRACTVCGFTETVFGDRSTDNHAWDKGELTAAPTYTEKGVITYTCTVCGATMAESERQSLQPVGHCDMDGDLICDSCNALLDDKDVCAYCHRVHPDHLYGQIVRFFHRVVLFFIRIFRG